MATTGVQTQISSYEEACASHTWDVPERYNIAADVCDKHPRDKLAMVWESFDGSYREQSWGELQDLSNQAAHLLRGRRPVHRQPIRRHRVKLEADGISLGDSQRIAATLGIDGDY